MNTPPLQEKPIPLQRRGTSVWLVGSRCLVWALLAWAGIALGWKVAEVFRRPLSVAMEPALMWRLGSAPVEEWRQFLEAVEQRVPMAAKVLVDAPTLDPADEFFLSMWCAYYLPRHEVVRRNNLVSGAKLPKYRVVPNGAASFLRQPTQVVQSGVGVLDHSGGAGERLLLEGPGLLLYTLGPSEAHP